MSKRLYKIEQGSVCECSVDAVWDGEYSVLAYAHDAHQALQLCSRYDGGTLQPDNIVVDGVTVVALDGDPYRE